MRAEWSRRKNGLEPRVTLAEEYQALTVETLNRYLAERQDEHLRLDFKLVNDPGPAGACDPAARPVDSEW